MPTPSTGLLKTVAAASGTGEDLSFLLGEWVDVVDAWQVPDGPAYRDMRRLGRKTRLPERRREVICW